MPRTLLVACGNSLRSDDGVGWHVAAAARVAVPPSRLHIIPCHQLTPELADAVAAADRVVFVDAACNDESGAVRVRALRPGDPVSARLTLHQFGPGDVLRLAAEVHGRAPSAWLVTVGAGSFEFGEGLSPGVAAAVGGACAAALRALELAPRGSSEVVISSGEPA
jgi:hydrogenase maturation protease